MTFEEWEKEHSAEYCPHVVKKTEPLITKTRCRLCVWQAAQKEGYELGKNFYGNSDGYRQIYNQGKKEGNKELAEKLKEARRLRTKDLEKKCHFDGKNYVPCKFTDEKILNSDEYTKAIEVVPVFNTKTGEEYNLGIALTDRKKKIMLTFCPFCGAKTYSKRREVEQSAQGGNVVASDADADAIEKEVIRSLEGDGK